MVACLTIPAFSLRAPLLQRPELEGRPVALAPAPGERALLGSCTRAAERAGVRPGMRLSEALATCPQLELLEFFFQIHDPTTLNRQGNDFGTSYRSAIYYLDEEQRRVAEDTIADVEASGLWPGKVVTEVEPAGPFWEAEPEHQDYLEKYPNGYTCHFPRPGWILPRRAPAAAG